MSNSKPREFFVVHGNPYTVAYESYDDAICAQRSFEENVGQSCYVEHVIEHSAFQRLQKQNEIYKRQLEEIKIIILREHGLSIRNFSKIMGCSITPVVDAIKQMKGLNK